jgi:hypothetical protein
MESDSFLNNTDTIPERRISPFDRPQRFVLATNYDLPIGKGKLVNLENRWADTFAGGWRVNFIYSYQAGAPLQFMNGSTNNPGDYVLCAVATRTTAGACPSGSELTNINPNTLAYDPRGVNGTSFDVSRFVTSSANQFQFHLRTLPTTFSALRSDGTNNIDASVLKNFSITEQSYFQFRLEAFNVMNRTQFGAVNLQATSSSFGTITSQANRPRQVQFGFRYVF